MTRASSNHKNRTQQMKYWLLSWVSLAQELVVILSFGYICPDWRGVVLFSEWMDE